MPTTTEQIAFDHMLAEYGRATINAALHRGIASNDDNVRKAMTDLMDCQNLLWQAAERLAYKMQNP